MGGKSTRWCDAHVTTSAAVTVWPPRCKSLVGEEISDGLSGEGPAIPSRFVRTVNSPLRSEPTTADTTTRARCSVGLRRVMWILVPDCGTCRKVRELEDCL